MEGNQNHVRKHKTELIKTSQNVMEEMMNELTFAAFTRTIDEEMAKSHLYEKLKEQERDLTQEIQETTVKYKKLQNDFSRETEENTNEMTELKKQKNETQVEKELHIQYLERQITGKQSCEDRLHRKKETELIKKIEELTQIIRTEEEVNRAVVQHLEERNQLLTAKAKEQE